jgi:hypothetical protein
MPLWLAISLLVTCVLVILYLLYLVISKRRWIRLHAFTAFAAAYFALPAFKLVIKTYGFDVDAAWNDGSWTKDVLAGVVLICLFLLEYNYQKGESHQKYFHEFTTVVLDNLRDGIEDKDIAKNRDIPLDKVQAIIVCMAWLDLNQHQKRSDNGSGEEREVGVG